MITKIQKWGNSLGLRIPKGVARGARVREGTTVTLAVSNGRLVVAPLETRGYALEALLAGVTAQEPARGGRYGRSGRAGAVVVPRTYAPDRGDLVWLEFNPQAGHEQAGHRPALVDLTGGLQPPCRLGPMLPNHQPGEGISVRGRAARGFAGRGCGAVRSGQEPRLARAQGQAHQQGIGGRDR